MSLNNFLSFFGIFRSVLIIDHSEPQLLVRALFPLVLLVQEERKRTIYLTLIEYYKSIIYKQVEKKSLVLSYISRQSAFPRDVCLCITLVVWKMLTSLSDHIYCQWPYIFSITLFIHFGIFWVWLNNNSKNKFYYIYQTQGSRAVGFPRTTLPCQVGLYLHHCVIRGLGRWSGRHLT